MFNENLQLYGVCKIWRLLKREGFDVGRSTVSRLMKKLGLKGAVRGKPVKTTEPDQAAPCPLDRVNRKFRAEHPNALWAADFSYVRTFAGFVYVAFIVDTFARRIVGWKVSRSMRAEFALDALEQLLHDRRPVYESGLIHQSDRSV